MATYKVFACRGQRETISSNRTECQKDQTREIQKQKNEDRSSAVETKGNGFAWVDGVEWVGVRGRGEEGCEAEETTRSDLSWFGVRLLAGVQVAPGIIRTYVCGGRGRGAEGGLVTDPPGSQKERERKKERGRQRESKKHTLERCKANKRKTTPPALARRNVLKTPTTSNS